MLRPATPKPTGGQLLVVNPAEDLELALLELGADDPTQRAARPKMFPGIEIIEVDIGD